LGVVRGLGEAHATGQAVRLFVRPEDIEALSGDVSPGGAGLRIEGRVKVVYFQGSSSLAEVQAGVGQPILFDASEYLRHHSLHEGDTISLWLPAQKIQMFG